MELSVAEADLVDAVRHSERSLDGRDATDRYVDHAKHVRAFDVTLRARRAPIKATYREARLDYLLARKALWLCEFLEAHEREHPALWTKGPSILLFGREAERRLDREGRAGEARALLRELAAGAPRDAVRKKYFRGEPSPASELMAALRKGRMEPARRAFLRLDASERSEVLRFSHALSRLVEANVDRENAAERPTANDAGHLDAPDSITRAANLLEATGS